MKFLRTMAIVIFIISVFPRVVHAEEEAKVIFYTLGKSGEYQRKSQKVIFKSKFNINEKIYILMDNLFEKKEDMLLSAVPSGTKVIWFNYSDGLVILNLSENAENIGGNYAQKLFSDQIIGTLFSLNEVNRFNLYIEGNESGLSEGQDFSYYNKINFY